MEIEKPQRTSNTPTTTSELFICFTSHSSSMRLSSKSILSPCHNNSTDNSNKSTGSHSLTTSLSRRLRHNTSLRSSGAGSGSGAGCHSPAMFSSKKNKNGPGFENPEPSSPKVTCIGQVRVKTKKQGKKMKMRACRSKSKRLSGGGGGGGEVSFRRVEHNHVHGGGLTPQNSLGITNQGQDRNLPHRNQRWVHLPLTICEALRSFGNEFSCLLPCKSSCFSSCNNGSNNNNERGKNYESSSSCGAVCRWLVALQEGEEEKGGDIELVVGSEERDNRVIERECSRRRSIFDDMEFKDEIFDEQVVVEDEEEEEESGRVSICIPPKNALLLMRCRSDPMKMSALSQKIWESPVDTTDFNDDEIEVKETKQAFDKEEKVSEELVEGCVEIDEICEDLGMNEVRAEVSDTGCDDLGIVADVEEIKLEEIEEKEEVEETELMEEENEAEGELVGEGLENEQVLAKIDNIKEEEEGEKEESSEISSTSSSSMEESTGESQESQEEKDHQELETVKSMDQQVEKEEVLPFEDQGQKEVTHQKFEPILDEKVEKWEKNEQQIDNNPVLPDCLLLMMCEPKLSMEVSKETWVCTTDFIRWLPERHPKKVNKTDGSDEPKKKKPALPPPAQPVPVQPAVQPARSSISFPTGGGKVANLIEQKMVKTGKGIEPCALTRCKSAPMRSTAKNVPPELPCSLWRRESSRKIEPHRPSFGATGVGF